jgi:alpha-amylase/alpha-mannosidase (GH57 family)
MHQPYYKRLDTGEHVMPWVRLHATKDYLDMPLVVEECRGTRATFNLVPSLLEQIEEFAGGKAREKTLDLSRKKVEDLSPDEKRFIIGNFFICNQEEMISPYPQYHDLFTNRKWAGTPEELNRAVNYFSAEDVRDLQVWYNLTWIDPLHREKNDFLKQLIVKGAHFTEEEKHRVLDICQELIRGIIPTYNKLQKADIIEISASPFYHPILPLLYDTDFCRRAEPACLTPRIRFHHPEDVQSQIQTACDFYREHFEMSPRGMWPSEGSVCPEIIPFFVKNGINWIATDEEILALSQGRKLFSRDSGGFLSPQEAEILYQPYRATFDNAEITILFRDHFLSDLIGFHYAGWDPEHAAEDLITRFKLIYSSLPASGEPFLAPVILDGENCWEFYKDDGLPFLRLLYSKIQEEPDLETITPSQYLKSHPARKTLARLHTGSWINHNFYIWIGHEADRKSWEKLAQSKKDIEQRLQDPKANISIEAAQKAKKLIAIAEGSDWNWWYGDDHSSGIDEQFDELYRFHLIEAYRTVNLEVPAHLLVPIFSHTPSKEIQEPKALIHPIIDGRNSGYFEWLAAGLFEPSSGSMHRSQFVIKRLLYGFDLDHLYIRIDPNPEYYLNNPIPITFSVIFLEPYGWRIEIKWDQQSKERLEARVYEQKENGTWEFVFSLDSVAARQILEMAIPFSRLGLKPGITVHFHIIVQGRDHELEQCPSGAPVSLIVPDSDYEKSLWLV